MGLLERLKNSYNAFIGRDPTYGMPFGYSYPTRPDRVRFSRGNERSIITSIYNRIAVDAASIDFKQVKVDKDNKYIEDVTNSGINNCLTFEANIDQTGRAFIQDIVMSMLDEGCVAIVPTDASQDIRSNENFDILTMRTGKITEWYPMFVKVEVYNERRGKRQEIILPKRSVAIIENPFYAVMNEPNSNLQRLIRKLSLLDVTDENTASGKLDLIIQLPYVVKTPARREQAEERRKLIESQLEGSKYGVAYTDGTEKITQLNRSVENQLLNQVKMLQEYLFAQMGITQAILDGSAEESVMQNYYTRTIEPILSAIADELIRKFISKIARTQGHTIMYFRDPFKLVPVGTMADLADKLTRNEIMSPNEMRQKIGLKPVADKDADELRNRNISESKEQIAEKEEETTDGPSNLVKKNTKEGGNQNGR